jgi:hypothetical protein
MNSGIEIEVTIARVELEKMRLGEIWYEKGEDLGRGRKRRLVVRGEGAEKVPGG